MRTSTIFIDETVSHMSAPIADPAPAALLLDPAPSPPEDDRAAWAAWRGETFTDLRPAPVAPPSDPEAAQWDDFRKSTFPDLNR